MKPARWGLNAMYVMLCADTEYGNANALSIVRRPAPPDPAALPFFMHEDLRRLRQLVIVTACVGAGALGGLMARVGHIEISPAIALLVGALLGGCVSPSALWVGLRRRLSHVLPALLLLPMGVCAWMGPRANMALTITAALCVYALGLVACAFFMPIRHGASGERATEPCPVCAYPVPLDAERCPSCAVQRPVRDSSSSRRPASSSTRSA